MTSPQLEHGYTRLANELYEAIIGFPLTGYQQRVLHAIIRKTYGYGKKSDSISLSQISEITKIAKPHICRAIKELKQMNIVTTDGKKTGVNKNHDSWLIVTKDGNGAALPPMVMSVTTDGNAVTTDGNKSLPPAALQKKYKETNTKETIQKKERHATQKRLPLEERIRTDIERITESFMEQTAEDYQTTIAFTRSKKDDLLNYCLSKGREYKNYGAELRKWVKKDALERREHAESTSRIAYVGEPVTDSS